MLKDAGTVERLGGNLAPQAEQALIRGAVGANLFFQEALIRKLDLAELTGPAPTPLERLLADAWPPAGCSCTLLTASWLNRKAS